MKENAKSQKSEMEKYDGLPLKKLPKGKMRLAIIFIVGYAIASAISLKVAVLSLYSNQYEYAFFGIICFLFFSIFAIKMWSKKKWSWGIWGG